jgi:hypothetical protein
MNPAFYDDDDDGATVSDLLVATAGQTNCQLKVIDIEFELPPNIEHDLLSALQILDYLKRLTMPWCGRMESD